MKEVMILPKVDKRVAQMAKPTSGADLNQAKTVIPASHESISRLAHSIYEKQGSQPGHEVKQWLEAESQLFGGVERESQMHPGSSLFAIEH